MAKTEIEFIADADIYSFFEKGMRGFLTFLRDIVKPVISIWNLMTKARIKACYMLMCKQFICQI